MKTNLFGPNKTPFKVPDGYFEQFKVRVSKEDDHKPEERKKIKTIISIMKPWLSMAAGFILIALVYYQVPGLFLNTDHSAAVSTSAGDSLLNSLALIVDEQEINELVLEEASAFLSGMDTTQLVITEEELALLTLFN